MQREGAVSYTHLEHEKAQMDKMMRQYADCVEEYAGKRFSDTPGAGAAGGLGFAFLFGLENVELKSCLLYTSRCV